MAECGFLPGVSVITPTPVRLFIAVFINQEVTHVTTISATLQAAPSSGRCYQICQ